MVQNEITVFLSFAGVSRGAWRGATVPPGRCAAGATRRQGCGLAYIAYRMQTGPVGLMVTPDSVAVASGGVEVDFKKVSFHYGMVEGYKVVSWSIHGLTYALVSHEGNSTQQSCMVCHSAMRDRELSHTPTPLGARKNIVELFSN
jgi:hypothetical protein